MSEMIARRGHNEVEVPVGLLTVTLGHDCLKCSCCLFEGNTRLCGFAVHFTEAQTEPQQGVTVRMKIVAELRRKGRRVWWKNAISPYHCTRLTARDKPAPESSGYRFVDIGDDFLRRCWHSRSPAHKRRL